jgi:microcystin-dependent protein
MKTPARTWPLAVVGIAAMLVSLGARPVEAGCARTPFLGEICTFAADYCPKGFAPTNGQLLSINANQALFALLGTNFGGNGVSTFALPDLRGATAMGTGQGNGLPDIVSGQTGGGAATATVLAGNEVQVPATPLPFVGLTQCIALVGLFPTRE